ncbi:MAG: hypothetical protein RIF32_10295 [Leptospirales bacterium]|jgi:hypothetical protein
MYPFPTQTANRALETQNGIRYIQVGADFVDEFTRFVYRIFSERISKRQDWRPTEAELTQMVREERLLLESGIFVAALLPGGELVGAMRAARWRSDVHLATERIFQIDHTALARLWGVPTKAVWHISQMCVDGGALARSGYGWRQGNEIMRRIIRHIFRTGSHLQGAYGIMESDDQINAYLKRYLGIETWSLSPVKNYIGQTYATAVNLDQIRELDYVRSGKVIAR